MPVPTTNNGNVFYNQNECRTFNQTVTTALTKLSSFPCSEVILVNRTGNNLSAYDSGYSGEPFAMQILNNGEFTFRGLTNSDQLSAKATTAGPIFYRTQYFSSNPSR